MKAGISSGYRAIEKLKNYAVCNDSCADFSFARRKSAATNKEPLRNSPIRPRNMLPNPRSFRKNVIADALMADILPHKRTAALAAKDVRCNLDAEHIVTLNRDSNIAGLRFFSAP